MDTANQPDERKRISSLLRSSFADVPCPYASCSLSHEYWKDMREHLHDLSADELQWELPRILENLLYDNERENLDMVLSHLNVEMRESCGDEDHVQQERRRYLRSVLRPLYQNFTKEQACAIKEWLVHVRSWQEYAFFDWMVDSAISYWSERCKS